MDNDSKRRVGRPKTTPQSGPLVIEGSRARMTMDLPMADATGDELKEYVRWVELSATMTTNDALFATVDFALRDLFRRDRLWQEQRRKPGRPEPSARGETQAAAPATSPSSLPPVSSGRSLPPPPGSPVSR